jgi:hypothetical protein
MLGTEIESVPGFFHAAGEVRFEIENSGRRYRHSFHLSSLISLSSNWDGGGQPSPILRCEAQQNLPGQFLAGMNELSVGAV